SPSPWDPREAVHPMLERRPTSPGARRRVRPGRRRLCRSLVFASLQKKMPWAELDADAAGGGFSRGALCLALPSRPPRIPCSSRTWTDEDARGASGVTDALGVAEESAAECTGRGGGAGSVKAATARVEGLRNFKT